MNRRIYGIWYVCIAAGFTLLALFRIAKFHGDGAVLRLVIAAGFAALAALEFRSRK